MSLPTARRNPTAQAAGLMFVAGSIALAVALERRLITLPRGLGDPRRPIRTSAAIRASAERVWEVLADLPAQPRWMHDLKAVRIVSPGPIGAGTRAEGRVRMFGLTASDPIEISAWQPPLRFGLRHLGRFRGWGEISLSPLADGVTVVRWEEVLVAPVLPVILGLVTRPVFQRVFSGDLRRLRALVEHEEEEARRARRVRLASGLPTDDTHPWQEGA